MREPRQPSLTRAMIAARFCDPVKDDLGAHKLRTPEEVEAALDCMMQEREEGDLWPVSYTHLTLPTIYSV